MGFDNRLVIDCFTNVATYMVIFFTNDRFRSEKYEPVTLHPSPLTKMNILSFWVPEDLLYYLWLTRPSVRKKNLDHLYKGIHAL